MSVSDCPECQRLREQYFAATTARLRAEAELTSAIFSHNPEATKRLKRIARSKLGQWARAAEALRRHQETHLRSVVAGVTV
jgi:uncharacterized protein (UPF0212 family)